MEEKELKCPICTFSSNNDFDKYKIRKSSKQKRMSLPMPVSANDKNLLPLRVSDKYFKILNSSKFHSK